MKGDQIRQNFPDKILEYIGEIYNMEYPPQGCTSTVCKVESAKGNFIIKHSHGKQFSQWLEKENQVLQVIGDLGIPIAKPHLFVKEEGDEPLTWLLMDYIPGRSLRSTLREITSFDQKLELLFQFGQVLRKIHAAKVPPELIVDQRSWVDRKVEEAAFNWQNFEVDGDETLLKRLQIEKPGPVQETFIHGDYTLDNVLVQGNQIIAVIDWTDGLLGDPRYDLALATRSKPEGFNQAEEMEAFYAGYGKEPITQEEFEYFVDLYEFF